jgi:predicted esterase
MSRRSPSTRLPRGTASVALLLAGCLHRSGSATVDAPGSTSSASMQNHAHAGADASTGNSPTEMPNASSTHTPTPNTVSTVRGGSVAPPRATNVDIRLLAVSGFETAIVAVPHSERAVPLLVATHGAGGDSRWECERWSRVARGRWFVACPTGVPLRRGESGSYYYPDHPTLEREVLAVVAAVRANYGARVSERDGVYLGYSQGATMGALMVVEHGADFPHLVLIEGGSGDWTLKRAERFRASGGQSVFIVCGTSPCAGRAVTSARTLERAGLHAVTRYAEGGGHTELGSVGSEAEALLETLAISAS